MSKNMLVLTGFTLVVLGFLIGCGGGGSGGVGNGAWTGLPTAALPPAYGTVSGIITDVGGNPISGAVITLVGAGLPNASGTTLTDGSYLLTAQVGTYTARITKTGFATVEQSISLVDGKTNTLPLNAVMSGTVEKLSGTVTEKSSGSPLAGVAISIVPTANPGLSISPAATDGSGTYLFTLAPGPYTLSANLTGYSSSSANVTIASNSSVVQNFSIGKSTGRVLGLVADSQGTPQKDALIRLTLTTGIVETTTLVDGKYSFTANSGAATLTVSKAGFAAQIASVTILPDTDLAKDFKLLPGVTLSGTIKSASSKEALPNINARVFLSGILPEIEVFGSPTKSNVEGKFFIENQGPGLYEIRISDSSNAYAPATFVVQILNNGTLSPTSPEFFLSSSGITTGTTFSITGTVQASGGAALSGIEVRVYNSPPLTEIATRTKTTLNGEFLVPGLSPNLYEFNLSDPANAYQPATFVIRLLTDGTTSPLKPILTLKKASLATLFGTVKLVTNNQPLPNILVHYTAPTNLIGATKISTATGTFFFLDLPSDQYTISLYNSPSEPKLYEPATYVIQILPDGTLSPANPELFLSPAIRRAGDVVLPLADGTIYDAVTKAPVEYVVVTLKGVGSSMSDQNGKFFFRDLIPGSYQFTFSKSGYSDLVTNFSITDTDISTTAEPLELLPAALTYFLTPIVEPDLGAIEGRFLDPTTGLGSGNLVVKLYREVFISQKIMSPGDTSPTTEVVVWAFSSASQPVEIRITHTGVSSTAPLDTLGAFRIMNLAPNMYFDSNSKKWAYLEYKTTENGYIVTAFRYRVFVGKSSDPTSASLTTSVYNDPRDQGTPKSSWYVENELTNPTRNYSWPVDVKPNMTTYISNVDLPNY